MSKTIQITIPEKILILAILLLSLITTYLPHRGYYLPLHVDEWHHIAWAKEIVKTTSFLSNYPYSGRPLTNDLEIGYHMLLAGIHALTRLGINLWILTGIFSIFSVLSVFILTRRWGKNVSLLSSFLAALIPSTLAIGGPVFLIPVNLSLIFIPVGLNLAFDSQSLKHYLGLFSVSLFLLLAHPPSAIVLLMLIAIYSILTFNKHGKQLLATIFLSILISFPNYIPRMTEKGIESASFRFHLTLEGIAHIFGYIPTIFLFVGAFTIAEKRNPEKWTILIPIFLLLIGIVLFVYTGFNPLIPYQRIFLPLILLMSIVSAYGLTRFKSSFLIAGITILILILSIRSHLSEDYYHVINTREYQDFLWIRNNTGKDSVVLLDPWLARALTPVAERQVVTVMPFGPNEEIENKNKEVRIFLNNSCTETDFLISNNVSVIYSIEGCENSNLTMVKDRIYIFEKV
jgi:hypothetical protein